MLRTLPILIIVLVVSTTNSFAEGVTLIQLGQSRSMTQNESNKKLEERVQRLEMAVEQLQSIVKNFSANSTIKSQPPKIVHCYARNNINQTFTSTGKTAVEAKGKILKDCLFCKDQEIVCDE